MANTFRNTILSVFSDLFAHLKNLEGTSGSDSSIQIRKVAEGESLPGAHPNASVVLQLLSAKVSGRSDIDKRWAQALRIRITSQVTTSDGATAEILSKIGQVQDKIESFAKPDGVAGFEDSEWAITFGSSAEHGNIVIADSVTTFTVMVSKGAN